MTVTRTPREIADIIIAVNGSVQLTYDPAVEDDLRSLLMTAARLGAESVRPPKSAPANTPEHLHQFRLRVGECVVTCDCGFHVFSTRR